MQSVGIVKIFFTKKTGKMMKNQNNDEIIYSLNIADIQTVAQQEIGRDLTHKEIEKIKDSIATKIDWYDAISDAINQALISGNLIRS